MPLVPLDLTHVLYTEGDSLGKLCALLSLTPPFVLVALATLLLSRRDLATLSFLTGLLLSTALSSQLKPLFNQPRPTGHGLDHLKGYEHGMPSSHSVFVAFCAAYAAWWSHSGRWQERHLLLRLGLSSASAGLAASVMLARVYLHYHSWAQVGVGAALGAALGSSWFFLTEAFLRPWFPLIADTALCRLLLVRDCSSIHVINAEYAAARAAAASAQKVK